MMKVGGIKQTRIHYNYMQNICLRRNYLDINGVVSISPTPTIQKVNVYVSIYIDSRLYIFSSLATK